MGKIQFTIFTPTYNRVNTLYRVYESLCEQTIGGFEWLVVDDGSHDSTLDLVLNYAIGAPFPIRYFGFSENRGKHIAHNLAIKEAKGEFFLVADSDDWIVPNALERMHHHWSRLPDNSGYCGVAGLCADRNGVIVGRPYPVGCEHSTLLERKYIYKIKGEKWGFVRTDIARQYPFPELEGFVPEGLVWLDIARTYKDYCVNEVFRIYDRTTRTKHGDGPQKCKW